MNWNAPRYEEIKMDAEIGSYQVDPDEQPDPTVSGVAGRPSALAPDCAHPGPALV
jgi:hypothetical protein